jgi:hypothetical protein
MAGMHREGLSDRVPTPGGDGAIHNGRDDDADDGPDHDPPPRREGQQTPKRRLTGLTQVLFSCRIKEDNPETATPAFFTFALYTNPRITVGCSFPPLPSAGNRLESPPL